MTRRASLPGADELFRNNAPSLSAVREVIVEPTVAPAQTTAPVTSSAPRAKKGVRSIPRRRVTQADKSPSGREPVSYTHLTLPTNREV